MSAMHIIKDALEKAGFATKAEGDEKEEPVAKPAVSGHVAMDAVRHALDAAAPWWQSQGAEPKNGERIVNSPVEKETRPTALGAGMHMEAMQRKAGSRPPIGEFPDTPKGMADDEAITEDALVMDAEAASAELQQMQSELDKHDQQYHGGAYQGGACKLRDKVAKAAKNLGMQNNVIQGLVGAKKGAAGAGGAGGAGGVGAEAPEVPDEAEKAFKDKVASIKAKYTEARKAAEKAKDNAKVNRLVNGYVKQMQAARMEYLTNALNMSPAEAGACTEIAQKVDEGSPEAKKVVEELAQNPNLTDQQKAAVEVVQEGNEESADGETTAPEAEGSSETAAPAEGTTSPAAEPTDAQFEDELKKAFPDKAQMVNTLSQKFDGLNTSLNDEQKKKFWELNEGGDEAAFYTFLGDECGFSAEEVSALRDLTDAYRAANPNDYPEYAKQHKHDELLARVKKADRRLNNDVKRGKLSGIKNRLEIKGFSNEEIEQYMDAMGLTEDQKFAVMNDLPVPPKVLTPEEMAQKKAEQAAAEKMEAYRKAHDQASKDNKLDDPKTVQKLNDLLKEAMEAQKAAKNPAPAAPTDAPAQEATAPAEGTASAETGAGGEKAETSSPAPTAKATAEEVSAQPKEDPVSEGMTPEDHAKVCKANPKSNCPFLRAHMSEEALAALDKPEGAQPAATGETAAPAPSTGGIAAPGAETKNQGDGSIYPTFELKDGGFDFSDQTRQQLRAAGFSDEQIEKTLDGFKSLAQTFRNSGYSDEAIKEQLGHYSLGKEEASPAGPSETAESAAAPAAETESTEGKAEPSAAPAAETEAPSAAPPLPPEESEPEQGPTDTSEAPPPLPDYELPNVEGTSLTDEQEQYLSDLKDAYANAQTDEERQQFRELYEEYTAELDAQAALQQAKNDIEEDARAQEMEKKQPGFIQNMKNFFGGLVKSMKGDKMVNPSSTMRESLGLPKKGKIRQSELQQALARKSAESSTRKAEEAEKAAGEPTIKREHSDGSAPTTDIYEPLPREQTDTSFGENLQRSIGDELARLGVRANIVNRKDGSSVTEFEIKRDPSLSQDAFKKKLNEIGQNLGHNLAFESSQQRGDGKAFTGYVRVTNPEPKDALVRRLLETPGSIETAQEMDAPFLAGETADGDAVWIDLGEHGFLGGDSGGGKTERVRGGLTGMFHVKTPNQLQVMINAHANDGDYASIANDPHVRGIADSVEKVRENFKKANEEWDRRKVLFSKEKVKDLKDYNKKMVAQGTPEKQLPALLVVTDEATNLLQVDPSLANEIKKIVTNGRKFGVWHLGITQDMRADNIPSDIKGKARMGVRATTSDHAAQMIFGDRSKQEELKSLDPKGGMLVQTPRGIVRVRGAFAPGKDISHLVDYNARTFKPSTPKSPSDPNAPQPVPKDKRSADTHIANMPDGMEVHKGDGGRLIFKYGGLQYKQAERRNPDGTVTKGWKLADGSDPRLYTFDKPTPPPAS